MQRDLMSRRTKRWIDYNNFASNEKCKEKIEKLFLYFDVTEYNYSIYKGENVIHFFIEEDEYMVGLDEENVCLKIYKKNGRDWEHLYWKNFTGDTMWYFFLKWAKGLDK